MFAVGVAIGCQGNFLIGPPPIAGSGVAKDETRPVEAFHSLEAASLSSQRDHHAGAKAELKISGDDDRVPLVESIVRDGKLILRLKENSSISPKLPMLAEVVVSELDEVEASGAASVKVRGSAKSSRFSTGANGAGKRISVEGIESSQAIASAGGAAQVTISGSAATLKVDTSGASRIKAQALAVDDADVSISGASSNSVLAKKSIAGDVSGASQLELHGHPAKNTVSTSGPRGWTKSDGAVRPAWPRRRFLVLSEPKECDLVAAAPSVMTKTSHPDNGRSRR